MQQRTQHPDSPQAVIAIINKAARMQTDPSLPTAWSAPVRSFRQAVRAA
jgi:hypothetical protein